MSEVLALKYRPRIFEDMVGQRAAALVLKAMVSKDDVPSAMIFDGPRGCGKTTSARILGAALNCLNQAPPCGSCPSCHAVASGSSLDVLEIDAASNGLVDNVRSLRETLLYTVGGNYRVVLLDEAHSMSREAFNALLKILEEPPPRTVFVLLTTEPGKILPTVASRCMTFTFRRISIPDLAARLQWICERENVTCDPQLLTVIAERADGGMRDAVMLLDQMIRAGVTTLGDFREMMGDPDFAPAMLSHMADGDTPALFSALDEVLSRIGDYSMVSSGLIACLRDVLVLSGGGTLPHQGEALQARQGLAERLSRAQVTNALRVFWDLWTKVRAGTNQRSALDVAVVMCQEALAPKETVTPVTVPGVSSNGHGGLTRDQMVKLMNGG